MAPDYVQMMDDLRAGKLDEIEITPETFLAFRSAWTNYPARKEIVGSAKREGIIIYHYQSATDE
ncbi:MAG: hypothetical protein LKJ29_07325 [Lactobacillus sp.]|jgi:hypothetical protein|uniref:Uncharacterized protein n=1 Tax=Lacticaseibacillus suilingensis TaxID=2799577 RepID=A0ABW4BFR0_9LACO|nr:MULTISPECIES: hypothetical protein [Lacticaseibacillus]MCI1893990.1 hypothetical protein [Lactobacillus sp.]MCI1941848.1 hypothetical protein [Lactobacillus sp.]MCI1972570.1 hypothetical protein [Lactobacillus sp.]MCI2017654.1 hypothetical protein [Lactobacillus sp.]MCI2037987.1 hypothetical protein [Lactobacillus sp.]